MKLTELADRYRRNTTARLVEIDMTGTARSITYAELGTAVDERISDLRTAGIGAGSTVGLRLANGIDWVIWDLALLEVGAVLKAFPHDRTIEDVDAFLTRHGLALFVDGERTHRPAVAVRAAQPDADLHSLVYSSGTSGLLKGLRVSRRGTEYVIDRFIESFSITSADRHVIFLPLANYQQRLSVYCCLWTGADLVLSPYEQIFTALRTESPTFLIAPPVFYDAALQLHRRAGTGESLAAFFGDHIRFMITGMAPIRRITLDGFWSAGMQLLEAYGMTESGMIAWNTPDAHRLGTVGRLIDADAVTFMPDGELVINRPTPLSTGYFDVDESVAAETYRPDGTIATGDFGRLEDGFLTLVGRKKDIITLGNGRKLHPATIEARFAEVAGIAELVVVQTAGQRVGAIVTPMTTDDDARTAVRAAISSTNEGLPSDERIVSLVFRDSPLTGDPRFMTANLKISRAAASEYLAEQSTAHRGSESNDH
ncbi:AMP-binding protein [Micromonospora sp. NPDC005215]|uniref:AMP-binding protein n=1 Tax=Micromonospora sp. NPDC005215 TaxID=3157024 RepID=UPI0033A18D07